MVKHMKNFKGAAGVIIMGSAFFLAGCGDLEKAATTAVENVEDVVQSELTQDDAHVVTVKEGFFDDYPDATVGEAFTEFFSSPKWKYFSSEENEDVVEFTGNFVYQEVDAKATIQFLLDENDRFEIGSVAFNDLPQNALNTTALLMAIFEDEEMIEEAVAEEPEAVEQEPTTIGLTTTFPIGTSLEELMAYYGSPTYDDYFMGARLIVFNDEDGYYLDEATTTVSGFMIANPNVSVFGAYMGMTPAEVSGILGEPIDSYFDESETQMFVKYYYIDNYKITFYSDQEGGPTSSINVISD